MSSLAVPASSLDVNAANSKAVTVINSLAGGFVQTIGAAEERWLRPKTPDYPLRGRDEFVARVCALLSAPGGASVALTGLPGVGKTALVEALAHDERLGQHFEGRILWTALGEEPDPFTRLGEWAMALGLAPSEAEHVRTAEARTHFVKSKLDGRRALLIVDDIWKEEDARNFVDARASGCSLLLTTRFPRVAQVFNVDECIQVPELEAEPHGVELLARAARVDESFPFRGELPGLVRAYGGLPFALVLMGRFLRNAVASRQPARVERAMAQLRPGRGRRSGFVHHARPLESLQQMIRITEATLEAGDRRALRALSVLPPKPSTFSEEAFVAVAAATPETLERLTDSGLVENAGPGRYTLHQTIAIYAREKLSGTAPHRRMVRYYVKFVEARTADHDLLAEETQNVFAALQQASARELPRALVRGVNAVYGFAEARGGYAAEPLKSLFDRAADVAREVVEDAGAPPTAADRRRLVVACLNVGRLLEKRGKYERAMAMLEEGLGHAARLNDAALVSEFHLARGSILLTTASYPAARVALGEALKWAERVTPERPLLVSQILQCLGDVAFNSGDPRGADEMLRRGRELAEPCGDAERLSGILLSSSWAAFVRGEYQPALDHALRGLDLARERNLRHRVVALSHAAGAAAHNTGRFEESRAHLEAALAEATALQHPWYQTAVLNEWGEYSLKLRDLDAAQSASEAALEIAQGLKKSPDREAFARFTLARIAVERKNWLDAHAQGRMCLDRFCTIGHFMVGPVREWLAAEVLPHVEGLSPGLLGGAPALTVPPMEAVPQGVVAAQAPPPGPPADA